MAAKSTSVKTLDIDGLTVHIDSEVMKSWTACRLMCQFATHEEITAQTLPLMVEFVELVSDTTEAEIVEHCGGAKAPIADVLAVMVQIIQEAAPKNF